MALTEPLTVEGANLLILISILSLIVWFIDICRRIFAAYELSVNVSLVSDATSLKHARHARYKRNATS